MPREFSRADRVADAIQRELAPLIRAELRDPRVGIVNVTGVEVSRDLAVAKVYVSFVALPDSHGAVVPDTAGKGTGSGPRGAPSAEQMGVDALNGAAGFLRTLLVKQVQLRIAPTLKFIYDATGARGQHLSALIDRALAADRKRGNDDDLADETEH